MFALSKTLCNYFQLTSFFERGNKSNFSDYNKCPRVAQAEIISDEWGSITLKINGFSKKFKDVVILPSKKLETAEDWNWKWNRDSMHHQPGIRILDVQRLIFSKTFKPDVIILGLGRGHGGQRDNPGPGILEVAPEVIKYIKDQGVEEVYALKTLKAIEKYNEIRKQGQKHIAALIHTTC